MRVPKLWSETIETHRHAVSEAILDTTWALITEHGPTSVTMSQIAEKAGIGRATLYKYFPDVETILFAWHERQISAHLGRLTEIRDQTDDVGEQLDAVLEAYAFIAYQRGRHGAELGKLLHRDGHTAQAQRHLSDFIGSLLAENAAQGSVRDDIAPDELAAFCLHALTAAAGVSTEPAVHRLVAITLDGIRPRRPWNASETTLH